MALDSWMSQPYNTPVLSTRVLSGVDHGNKWAASSSAVHVRYLNNMQMYGTASPSTPIRTISAYTMQPIALFSTPGSYASESFLTTATTSPPLTPRPRPQSARTTPEKVRYHLIYVTLMGENVTTNPP
jgi:hypothetical protein